MVTVWDNQVVDFEEFEREYLDLVNNIIGSGAGTYEVRLQDWFAFLDTSPEIFQITSDLEKEVDDFEAWKNAQIEGHKLILSKSRPIRLGQQLMLFRYFSEGNRDYSEFALEVLYSENRFDLMVVTINQTLFEPFARDLLTAIRRSIEQGEPKLGAPASDRVVTLDHNSEIYKQTTEKLKQLERAVVESNEIGADHEVQRDQLVSELSAGQRLLRASRVRLQAIWVVLVPALRWLISKFADKAVGILAGALLALLAAMLGVPIPGL